MVAAAVSYQAVFIVHASPEIYHNKTDCLFFLPFMFILL